MQEKRTASARRPVSVLYLAGYGRSGSTIIGKVLGELERATYVGEVNFFWSDGILGNRHCGCGASLTECPVWSRVITGLRYDPREIAETVVHLMTRTTRTRHGIASLTRAGSRCIEEKQSLLVRYLDDLYRAIASAFDAELIIDSSKSPMYERALRMAPGLKVQTVHLVRDPRAAAHSWRNPKSEPIGTVELPTYGIARTSVLWTVTNLLVTRGATNTDPQVRVRYEDFMADPKSQLAQLGRLLDRDLSSLVVSAGGETELGTSHTIAGNPDRFSSGRVKLAPDDRWRPRISRTDHSIVTALALPGIRRYGYPVRRVSSAASPSLRRAG